MAVAMVLPFALVTAPAAPAAPAVRAAGAAQGTDPVVVSLTFDDGRADNAAGATILENHGLSGVFYVNSARVGTSGFLTASQLTAMQAAGHEIGGHTVNHADLPTLSLDEGKRQVCDDRVALMGMGLDVTSFAYPYGDNDAATEAIVNDCGYNSARDVGGIVSPDSCSDCALSVGLPPADLFAIPSPDSIKSGTTLDNLKGLVRQAQLAGGGWVPIVMHGVCDSCGDLVISPALLDAFAEWLAAESVNGVIVKTVHEVIGGTTKPAVDGPAAPPAGTGANRLTNPSFEAYPAGSQLPTCWQRGGYGTNSVTWSRSGDARTGSYAQRADVTGYANGDRRLISPWDLGACAPAVVAGRTYKVSGWYKNAGNVRMVVYYRSASNAWTFLAQGAALPSASTYTESTLTTPAVPAGATALSVGYSLRSNGFMIVDDMALADSDQTPPAVSLTSPRDNSLVRGSVTVSAAATDASGIARVDFLANGVVVGTDSDSPYSMVWDSTSLGDQSVGITALAVDRAGNEATAPSHWITVGNSVEPDAIDPTVSLTSPAAGEVLSSTTTLRATANDNDAVSYVEFLVNGVLVGVTNQSPYEVAWDSFDVPDGDVTVLAAAYDRSGNRTESESVTAQVANSAEDMTAPVSAVSCGGTACSADWYASDVSVTLSATDDKSGVERIVFTTDGSSPTRTNGTTYTQAFKIGQPTTVTYRAYDRVGNAEPEKSVILKVDTVKPSGVAITSPAAGTTVSGITAITTTSADNVGIVRVKFYLDGLFMGSRTKLPMQWNWDTASVAPGTHLLQVAAFDAAGNFTKSPTVSVTR